MTDGSDEFDKDTERFARHLKMDSLGRVSMRARDQETRTAWAGADDRTRVGSRIRASIRFLQEFEERHAELHKEARGIGFAPDNEKRPKRKKAT